MHKNCLKAADYLLSLVFPERCTFCDRVISVRERGVCRSCKNAVEYIHEPSCMKCGRKIEDEREEYCHDCSKRKHVYDRGYSLMVYDETVSRSIYRFKYGNRRRYADFYARQIWLHKGELIRQWNADVLIPVPLHRNRFKKRGYNQAQLIAQSLGRYMKIPVDSDCVYRVKDTKAMKLLSPAERQNNLKKAFIIRPNGVKYGTAILIDDIYTTGSTIDAIATVLKEAGVGKVYFLSVSSGNGQ